LPRKELILGLETPAIGLHTRLRFTKMPIRGTTQEQRLWNQMASDRQNLQDAFLNQVRETKTPVTVFLINGVKLQGVITWFDNFCILLRRDGQSQLVYKHAVSTIMPSQPINLYDGDEDA